MDFNSNERLDQPVSGKMLQNIAAGTYRKNKTRQLYYRWAAVAAALFLVCIGYRFLTSKTKTVAPVAVAHVDKATGRKQWWRDEVNQGERSEHLSLNDGSQVELAVGSRIHCLDSFATDKRDVYLSGSAVFKVEKDATRPFTVYAGHLHVTVLGTVFKVTGADEARKKMEVHLLSGRMPSHRMRRPTLFLLPMRIRLRLNARMN